jgi:hypothetical protein
MMIYWDEKRRGCDMEQKERDEHKMRWTVSMWVSKQTKGVNV